MEKKHRQGHPRSYSMAAVESHGTRITVISERSQETVSLRRRRTMKIADGLSVPQWTVINPQ